MTQFKIQARDVGERALSTFLQVFLAVVLAVPGARIDWSNAALIALFAAFVALLTAVLLVWGALRGIRNPYLDLAYRAAVTFLQTLCGLALAAGAISALSFDWTFALKTSAIAAGTALLKGLIGLHNPLTLGASPVVLKNPEPLPAGQDAPA